MLEDRVHCSIALPLGLIPETTTAAMFSLHNIDLVRVDLGRLSEDVQLLSVSRSAPMW
jgi:hypothetical protein